MRTKYGVVKRPPIKGAGGGLLLDRLLIPRIEQYGLNNNYADVDEVTDYLRRTYKEYQRRQLGPFRTMVTRAIGTLQRKGGVIKQELRLQSLEAQHLGRAARTRGGGGGGDLSSSSGSSRNDDESSGGSSSDDERDGSSSGGAPGVEAANGGSDNNGKTGASAKRKRRRCSGSGSGPKADPTSASGTSDAGTDSSDSDLEAEQAKQLAAAALPAAASHMNNSLLNMYARTTTPAAAAMHQQPGTASGTDAAAVQCGLPPPAFASPEVVAAAAARAQAKERAERKEAAAAVAVTARKAGGGWRSGLAVRGVTTADPDGPSTSGRPAAGLVAAAVAPNAGAAVTPVLGNCNNDVRLETTAVVLTAAGPQAMNTGAAASATDVALSATPGAGAGGGAIAAAAGTATTAVAAAWKGQRGEVEGGPEVVGDLQRQLPILGKTVPTLGRSHSEHQPHPPQVKPAAKRARRGTGTGDGGGFSGGGTRMVGGGMGGGGMGGGGGGNSAVTSAKPLTYADLGGIEEVLADIRELIEYPLKHPEVYAWLGVEPPRGVLLHGPPGCGKTALANAIANECGVPFLRVSAPEIVSGMSGESEAKLRQLFGEARDLAPCIVFIDEIDAIFPKRETAQREMERRIVAQMLTCMDDLSSPVAVAVEGSGAGAPSVDATAAIVSLPNGGGGKGTGDAVPLAARPPPPTSPLPPPLPHVVVIGATNRPDALDPALRRAGRFDREIALGIPTEAARVKILQVIARRLRLEGNFDFLAVAKRTPGFVGADLAALTKEAAAVAVTRIFAQLKAADAAAAAADATPALPPAVVAAAAAGGPAGVHADVGMVASVAPAAAATLPSRPAPAVGSSGRLGRGPLGPAELAGLAITMSDFETALPKVQPSIRREGFTTTPDVTWDDVGALSEVREELSFAITEPIRNPELFEALGLPAATGVLLYGPPGCGKTLVAKAVANESGANFISIKGPELLNKYVGESERAVRQLFARARAAHPCVLFFDELDALAPRRGTDNNQAAERVVNQLLTEMDGVDSRHGIFMVAATNRPDMIDPALLRPGRLDKVLYVPLPPPRDRAAILCALVRRTPMEPGLDLEALAADPCCDGFSGADVAALVREAAVAALKESMAAGSTAASPPRVSMRHFKLALSRVQPSVSRKDRKAYEMLRLRLRSTRSHIQRVDAESNPAAAEEGRAADGVAAANAGNDEVCDGDGDAVLEDVVVSDMRLMVGAVVEGRAVTITTAAAVAAGGGGDLAAADSMDDQEEEEESRIPTISGGNVNVFQPDIVTGRGEGEEGVGDIMETA